jgi:putative SOS response-associated peptidase YedK
MCGRYASARSRIELLEEFAVQRDRVDEPLAPDYNVAPTKPVYAVMTRQARQVGQIDESASSAGAELALRELRVVRWGLVPSWAKDISIGSRLINARAETVSEKPSFKSAFARRRCLLPADGYYEWQRQPAGLALREVPGHRGLGGAPRLAERPPGPAGGPKQPYYICRADHRPLAFAGLYEFWRDRALAREDPGAWLWTTTIITTSAADELGEIHDRMPMVIGEENWSDWLDPANTDIADVRALLTPAAVSGLTSYPVSLAVNSVRNNGPELIERADPVTSGATGAASPGARARPEGHAT